MPNKYTKAQLLEQDETFLRALAGALSLDGADTRPTDELIYAILDAQADEAASDDTEITPTRRRRITTKSSDHVYSASQTGQSERFDSPREERAAKRAVAAKAREDEAVATQALLGSVPLTPPKRKRGRPSKEELAERKAFEEMQARQALLISQAQAALNGVVVTSDPSPTTPEEDSAPEAMFGVPGASVDSSATDTTSSATPEETMTSHTATEGDLPDFIVDQMQQSSIPKAEEETPRPTSLADFYRQRSAEAEATRQQDQETKSKETGISSEVLRQAAEGADFIIAEDIPTVDYNNFSIDNFSIDLPTTPPPPYETGFAPNHAPGAAPKFRRFKEDALLQTRRQLDQLAAQSQQSAQLAATQPAALPGDIVIDGRGVLEVDPQGIGFLRSSDYNYMPSPDDVFVSQVQIRNYGLKMGDVVECKVKVPREGEKYFTLMSVERINGLEPHTVRDRVAFEHLTPLFPNEQFKLSTGKGAPIACRVVDLFSPIGKGQRALIVAQPKTGKTILMKQIANAIAANHPETYLMMLLIDERPEEVTDMARTVNAEVIASTFDEPATHHVRIAQMVLEKAKRMVECGHDVVIFLDSITRLARAFNTVAPTSGKILTGGVDANALQKPKRFFGAARNIEGGGSLTIIATALIDTGSKMDEVIFEEFKGTGNMELQLDRSLANKRIFPAVNLIQSSTRRDDLLLDETTLNRMYIIRNYMADMNATEAMEFVKKRFDMTTSNEEFILTMDR